MTMMQNLANQSVTTASRAQHVPIHDARRLTDGGATAQIQLDGNVYTLRITRAGKLILTK